MIMVSLQVLILLTVILLPLRASKSTARKFHIDTDTSDATYAINERGKLERITTNKPSTKNPRIRN